jgi:hypothetical protein
MAWQSLSQRLSSLPRVLAGPMLRKTTRTDVTVWLALRTAADVTLNVLDDKGVKCISWDLIGQTVLAV